MSLFAPLPEDLGSLTDAELAQIEETNLALIVRLHDGDADLIGDMSAAEVIAEMTEGVEQNEAIRSEVTAREAAQVEAAAAMADLAARAGIADPPADPPADPAEPAADPEPEPVVAAAEPSWTKRRVALARRSNHEPIADPGSRVTITASADVPGYGVGQKMAGRLDIAKAMIQRHNNLHVIPGGPVMQEKVPVARITREYPEELTLRAGDDSGNADKINRVTSRQSLAASGGLCAPVTPYYELMEIATDIRPVRDSLPRFNADRGGITFMSPPDLSAATSAVGHITAAADKLGGTNAAKSCLHITCPSTNTVNVDILYRCVQFGNLGARAWPEQVANFMEITSAAQAQLAEVFLLDQIAAKSTAVTGAQVGGAVNTLLGQILTAAAGYRSRHRMTPDTVLRVLLPEWSDDLLLVDLIRSQFQRFEMNDSGVEALLRSFGIAATYYIDGATGASQVFGTQNAGALLGFPTTVVWYMFSEGSFLWLDGGTLDLGVVRDSTLNSSNDYSVFAETFENLAFVGLESLKVTSSVCANGEVTAPRTVSCPVV